MPSPGKYLLAAALCLLTFAECGGRADGDNPTVRSDGTHVRISLDDIGGKRGAYFTYAAREDRKTDIIVYRKSDGTWRAVLDACRKCYRWRKGYVIDGDHVVCRKCGERYEIDSLDEGRGSCIPIPISSTREGKFLVIPVGELEAGAEYF